MSPSSCTSSLSSFGGIDNKIELIAGLHADGDQYLTLRWEVQYFDSKEINPIVLRMFLEGRFGRHGFGLSAIGLIMYQLWSPDPLTEKDIDSCKSASRDVDNMYRVINFGDPRRGKY